MMDTMDKMKKVTKTKYFKPAAAVLVAAKLFGAGKTLLFLAGGAAGYLAAMAMKDDEGLPFMKKDEQPEQEHC